MFTPSLTNFHAPQSHEDILPGLPAEASAFWLLHVGLWATLNQFLPVV